ncbi:MAG TPA: 50S ribosomal protein L34 [Candidatus Paceibacterota bacterium]
MSRTYKPKKKKRKAAHGFLTRKAGPARKILIRRRRKGRSRLTP